MKLKDLNLKVGDKIAVFCSAVPGNKECNACNKLYFLELYDISKEGVHFFNRINEEEAEINCSCTKATVKSQTELTAQVIIV